MDSRLEPTTTTIPILMKIHALAGLTAVLLCSAPPASGQTRTDDDSSTFQPPVAQTARRGGPVRIDGRPSESAWEQAPAVTRFVQREPVEGAAPEQPTEVRVLYDESAIYVSAVMREPQRIADQLVRRDERGQYDYFEVSFDPNNDRRTGYRFRVSAAGVQRDVYLYDDVRQDDAWDAVWQSAVDRDSTRWSVEIRIPLSQIKYEAADSNQTWGVNFTRRRLTTNEVIDFALESRTEHGTVSAFGRLEGLRFPAGGHPLELRPYAAASARMGEAEPGNPFFDGSEMESRAGLDLRYGISRSFSLDATINPDFGQVEVDPAVINLSAFETFFPEKRPFFVEDAQLFDFGLAGHRNRLFYSRRIGREPSGEPPEEAHFQDVPSETTILGAGKVTGRTPGGLTLGALAGITAKESAVAFDTLNDATERFVVEPAGGYGVLRARQDFREGASQAGAILTAVHRDLPEDGSFDFLTSSAFGLGVDFEHNWGGANSRDWVIFGHFASTFIEGSTEALIEVQTSSNHYFQRPDATEFSLDSTATSLTGSAWQIQFERRSARHWTGAVWIGEISPGFEANDIGFMTSNERLDAGARIGYHEIRPGRLFRSYEVRLFTFQNWRHAALNDPFSTSSWDHAHKGGEFNLRSEFEFLNYWELDLNVELRPETLSDSETRGGPLMVDPGSHSFEVGLSTDRRAAIFLRPSFEYTDRHRGGYEFQAELEAEIRPTPSVEIELSPRYTRELDPSQYVETTGDLGFGPTFGNRYVFADLKRRQVSLETRLNVAFSPTLTLQMFAQPLLSSGDYLTYKALERAESFEFDRFEEGEAMVPDGRVVCTGGRTCVVGDERFVDFDGDGTAEVTFDDQDFNIRSLRLNAVLRWEYRPGSTLFLVWQQNRFQRLDTSRFELGDDLNALFSVHPENMFILKVNYWLGL